MQPAPANALTAEQFTAIELARRQGRKISRAATVATVSGWTMGFFAFITLLTGFFSIVSLLLGAALAIVASIELRGAKMLRGLDERGPIHLGFNQIGLAIVVVLYCTWGIWYALAGPSPYDSYLAAGGDIAEMMEPIDKMNRALMTAFYVLVLGVSVVAQSCTSLYYFTRRHHLVRYLRQTPEWVVEMLRVVAR